MSGIKKISSKPVVEATAPEPESEKTPLYSLSINAGGKPVITPGVYSTFVTTDGESMQQIRKRAYARNTGGRYSRVQTITARDGTKYTIKHLIHHYSQALALDEVTHLSLFVGDLHIAQILGAEIYDDNALIVFEHVPGKTFFNWINSTPPPSAGERSIREAEIKTAIEAMHARGYAHLDISPNNIWIPERADRLAYLLDLGSSTPLGQKRNIISGTPGYYPKFENLTIATKALNNYGYTKLLELKPVAAKTKEAAGGAGKGSSNQRKRTRTRAKNSRKTRQNLHSW